MNIAVVVYTYDRVDDARINLEIIKNIWPTSPDLNVVKIIHSFNGHDSWYPQKYLEDELIRLKNPGHFQGAAELIDAGFQVIENCAEPIDYVVFLASDTWLVQPNFLAQIINDMAVNKQYIASCPWGELPDKPGNILENMAVDFFIIDFQWAKNAQIFPIDYERFYNKYSDLFYYLGSIPQVEKLLMSHITRAVHLQTKTDVEYKKNTRKIIKIISQREPVHEKVDENGLWIRRMYWPEIGLFTHHEPKEKQKDARSLKLNHVGPHFQKFIESPDLKYFNSIE